MNVGNVMIGLSLTGFAVLLSIVSGGVLLPLMLPVFFIGLKLLGVKME
jgi:hypothetical protein